MIINVIDKSNYVDIFVALFGALVTVSGVYLTFRYTLKTNAINEKRKTYANCLVDVGKILINPELIFSKDYCNTIILHLGVMELIASPSTIQAFKNFSELIKNTYEDMENFKEKNDPLENPQYFEEREQAGEITEVFYGPDNAIEIYERKFEQYKTKHTPSNEELSDFVSAIKNSMKEDIDNKNNSKLISK